MKTVLAAALSGFIFAVGLGLSGMTQPAKVVSFLDLFGAWDPSLMFVMIGAIAVHFTALRWIARRQARPLFASQWSSPAMKRLTPDLLAGAAIFGMGWGLAGFCPGPALTSLVSGDARPFLFVGGLLGGMALQRAFLRTRDSRPVRSHDAHP